MFIDKSYFINSINLPSDNLENIQSWIDKFEKEILIKSLGYELYTEFATNIQLTTPDSIWLDLRDGKEFEINSVKYKWNGLVNNDKISMLSYYIYSQYLNDLIQQVGTAGVYRILKLQLSSKASLYNFIYYTNLNSVIYENWQFEAIKPINHLGI